MNNKPIIRRCAFCGTTDLDSPVLISSGLSEEVCICPACAAEANRVFKNYSKERGELCADDYCDDIEEAKLPYSPYDMPPEKMIKPSAIYSDLMDYVIGQDNAKKSLAVAIYNHQKRLNDTTGLIRKSNILMVGPSGSGKTLLAQTLAKSMDVPFVIADATSLTEAGYVGDDVESILSRLLQVADGDIEKAERGIIFIDEIDKIARKSENPSITRDVSGEGVQHALLKIIEGADVSVPVGGGRKHPHGDNVMINTEKILFICGGAFEGLLKDDSETKVLGFNAEASEEKKDKKITQEMLKKYGLTPELLGRLPVIVQLDELTEDDLCRVLTEPKNSLLKEYTALFECDGVELVFKDAAIKKIAHLAVEKKIGARGLRSIIEDILMDIMFSSPDKDNIKKIIIEESTIDTKKPKYQYKKKFA